MVWCITGREEKEIMTNAEYIELELRKALRVKEGREWPTADDDASEKIRVKAEGPYGSSRWLLFTVAEFEAMITAGVAKITEREGN